MLKIEDTNRWVYRVDGDDRVVIACRYHSMSEWIDA